MHKFTIGQSVDLLSTTLRPSAAGAYEIRHLVPAPDGYPDKVEYWAGNIVPRWSYATVISNLNAPTSILVDTTAYRAGTPDAAVDLINQNFFGGEMPLVTRNALLTYIKGGTFNDARVRETIGLAISANAFQWY